MFRSVGPHVQCVRHPDASDGAKPRHEQREGVDAAVVQRANLQERFGALDADDYRDAIDHVSQTVGVEPKVGVGQAATAQSAGMDAKHTLEHCREAGVDVQLSW